MSFGGVTTYQRFSSSLFLSLVLGLGIAFGGFFSIPAHAADTMPDDLIISEIMNSWPTDSSEGLIITKVYHDGVTLWMEVFNPRSDTRVVTWIRRMKSRDNRPMRPRPRVGPGEYLYVCHWGPCGRAFQGKIILRHAGFQLEEVDGVAVGSRPTGADGTHGSDQVGWGKGLSPSGFESRPVPGGSVALVRRQSENGCPIDSGDNRSDFRTLEKQPKLGGYTHCPGTVPTDSNEFVEIYNPTDQPIDPVARDYRLIDEIDASGKPAQKQYELVGFPGYPHTERTELAPGQVGIVLGPHADTYAFVDLPRALLPDNWEQSPALKKTLLQKAHKGKIRLYTLRPLGQEEFQFFTDGLSEDPAESVQLLGAGQTPSSTTNLVGPVASTSRSASTETRPGQRALPAYMARERPALTSPSDPTAWIHRKYGSAGAYRSRFYPLLSGSVGADTTAADSRVTVVPRAAWKSRFVQVSFHEAWGPKRTTPDPAAAANPDCSDADYRINTPAGTKGEQVTLCLWTSEHPAAVLLGRRGDTSSLNLNGLPTGSGDKPALRDVMGRTALLVEFGDSTGQLIGDTVSTTSVGDKFAYTLVYRLSEQTVETLKQLGAGPVGSGSAGLEFYYADRYSDEWRRDESVTIRTSERSSGSGWVVRVSGVTRDLPGALGISSQSGSVEGSGVCLIQRTNTPKGLINSLRHLRDRIMDSRVGRAVTEVYYQLSSIV